MMPYVVAYVAGRGGSKHDAQVMWAALEGKMLPTDIGMLWEQMEQAWKTTSTGVALPAVTHVWQVHS